MLTPDTIQRAGPVSGVCVGLYPPWAMLGTLFDPGGRGVMPAPAAPTVWGLRGITLAPRPPPAAGSRPGRGGVMIGFEEDDGASCTLEGLLDDAAASTTITPAKTSVWERYGYSPGGRSEARVASAVVPGKMGDVCSVCP